MTAIAVPHHQARTARSSGLLKLTLTELKLLTRERVRVALPVAIPLILFIILGNISSLRQPRAIYGGESRRPAAAAGRRTRSGPLGTMAAWAVAFGLAAARFFRWE
jgi:hypothetical protein